MSITSTVKSMRFSAPALKGFTWTTRELSAPVLGSRLCIMTGMHVNEVSSIAAGFRLDLKFRELLIRGSISIMSFANIPALLPRTEFNCPRDGKNINFCFPGSREGTFSEAFADAVLNEWAADADCLIDLHGGDLCERVSKFTVVQATDDRAFDAFNLRLAQAFGAQLIMALPAAEISKSGRSCTGRAQKGLHAVFAEAGGNGLIDEESVGFHVDGVLRVAQLYGMIESAPPPAAASLIADRYSWRMAESEGWYEFHVLPGEPVAEGQILGVVRDFEGGDPKNLVSTETGYLLWRATHPIVRQSDPLMGIASRIRARPTEA